MTEVTKETLYFNPHQEENIDNFLKFVNEYKVVKFFFPNYEKAPWHVQCKVITDEGYLWCVNFWPHKHKAMADGYPVTRNFHEAMAQAFAHEDVILIEN